MDQDQIQEEPVQRNKSSKDKVFLIVGFLIVLLTILLILSFRGREVKKINQESEKDIPTLKVKKVKVIQPQPKYNGRLILRTKEDKNQYSQDEPITLVVYASSDGKPITGYDLVIPYNQEKVRYVSTKNSFQDFQIFSQIKNNTLTITGVKKLTVKTPAVFVDRPLVEIVFQPMVKGSVVFDLSYSPNDKTDSNLIDENTEEVLGGVKGVSLRIE